MRDQKQKQPVDLGKYCLTCTHSRYVQANGILRYYCDKDRLFGVTCSLWEREPGIEG